MSVVFKLLRDLVGSLTANRDELIWGMGFFRVSGVMECVQGIIGMVFINGVLRYSIWRCSSMCGNIFIGNGLSNIAV